MPGFGFDTKSTAPSSSARRVTSDPRSESDETMITGVGRRRISRSRKSMPSMRGISTSSVITSGLNRRIISRATIGSGATPTTSRSGSAPITSFRTWRTSAESSTIRTRVRVRATCRGFMARVPRVRSPRHAPWRPFVATFSYTVLPRRRKVSATWNRLSECPTNSSPSGCSSGAKRLRMPAWVGLSK